jgi:tetratricopeptide (TPR) repeat protein
MSQMRDQRAALLFVLTLSTLVVGCGGATHRPTPEELQCGATGDPDGRIKACTAIIQTPPTTQEARQFHTVEVALDHRAEAYEVKGRYDLAIQDYNQAIQLTPDMFGSFRGRGEVYAAMRQYSRAIQDFDQEFQIMRTAMAINPQSANVIAHQFLPTLLVNRGLAFRALGQKARADADFADAKKIDPSISISP